MIFNLFSKENGLLSVDFPEWNLRMEHSIIHYVTPTLMAVELTFVLCNLSNVLKTMFSLIVLFPGNKYNKNR